MKTEYLTILTILAVLFTSSGISAGSARAQTGDLESQIEQAKQQVNDLQQQLIENRDDNQNTAILNQEAFIPQTTVFFKTNLSLGSTGPEVRRLQVALNNLLSTPVAFSGAGSRGQESSYYGQKTDQAVTRFQNQYQAQILTPVGLTRGNGYFGPSTRNQLNILISNQQNSPTSGSESFSQSTEETEGGDSLSSLRSQFSITKYEFTQEDKEKIAATIPADFDRSKLPSYLQNISRLNSSDSTPASNRLREEYQRRLEPQSSINFLKNQFMAIESLFQPRKLARSTLDTILGVPQSANAQGIFLFGGRIVTVTPCPIPPGALMVTVIGPRPGSFTFFPVASQIRPIYNGVPRPAQQTLGSYVPGPTCFGPPPVSVPLTQGTVIQMGVSAI